jgi:IclR family pca regulon transcriptional regulator
MKHRGNAIAATDVERYRNRSLTKGLAILQMFASEGRALSAADISTKLKIERVTAFRFISTLLAEGFIEQDAFTKLYVLTPRILHLGFSYLNSISYVDRARPYLDRLSTGTGHSVNMAILDGTDVIYVARTWTRAIVAANLHVGSRFPAYRTSAGLVLLAALSETEFTERLRATRLEGDSPNARGGKMRLRALIDAVRTQQYAIANEEFPGLRSAAAGIRDDTGRIAAAVNIAVPAEAVSLATLRKSLLPQLQMTANEISLALGFQGIPVSKPGRNRSR